MYVLGSTILSFSFIPLVFFSFLFPPHLFSFSFLSFPFLFLSPLLLMFSFIVGITFHLHLALAPFISPYCFTIRFVVSPITSPCLATSLSPTILHTTTPLLLYFVTYCFTSPCYLASCFVILPHPIASPCALLFCFALLLHNMLCLFALFHALLLCFVTCYFPLPYCFISHHTLMFPFPPYCFTLPCYFTSPCCFVLHHTLLPPFTPCYFTSPYYFLPHYVTSSLALLFPNLSYCFMFLRYLLPFPPYWCFILLLHFMPRLWYLPYVSWYSSPPPFS